MRILMSVSSSHKYVVLDQQLGPEMHHLKYKIKMLIKRKVFHRISGTIRNYDSDFLHNYLVMLA